MTEERKPLTLEEIAEVYEAILSRTPDRDPRRAREGLEAYLAGYNRFMPKQQQGSKQQ
jgi:hypothetical protein